MEEQSIRIEQTKTKKEKIPADQLIFGHSFTDHMFVMDYSDTTGWHNASIVPYQPITLHPSSMIFHYGQSVFEGMKAFRTVDGTVQLFRPEKNLTRLNHSNDRLVIPEVDEDFVLEAIKKLVALDQEWVPDAPGTSLYIRPFIISTEPYIGVKPSDKYKLMVIMSPVGSYYKEGINPVKIAVENHFVRTVRGGTGEAKTGGNYAASLKAQDVVEEDGYEQVLWLDGVERKYIEEVGSMNVFFKINGEVLTPELNGSILEGITRNSVIQLLKYWNVPVTERRISMQEVYDAHKNGQLEEAFGSGTAAVISPMGELAWEGEKIIVNDGKIGELSQKIYDTITGIQYGKTADPFNWAVPVETESKVK